MTGYITEAARILGDAQRVDPLYAFLQTGTFQAAFAQGDDAACFDLANKLTRSGAVYGRAGHFYLADRARRQGDHAAAEKHYRASAKFLGQDVLEPVVVALKSSAAVPVAIKAINEARDKNPAQSPVAPLIVGAQREYLEALDSEILRDNRPRIAGPLTYAWRFVGAEGAGPSFKKLARDTGLVAYWRKHGWPDRCRAKGEDDFECS